MVSRGWCWTHFNLETFIPIDECTQDNALKYGIYQLELCPDTDRVHVQGYFEFVRGVRLTHVQRILGGEKCHCEPRHGTPQHARKYCLKEETQLCAPTEFGELPEGQGERTDLQAAFRLLDQGQTPQDVSRAYPETWARYWRAMDRYYLEVADERDWEMDVRVHYGSPGSGKTSAVFAEARSRGYALFTLMGPNLQNGAVWWDGYRGQEIVLIDDFYGWLPWTFLLQLLDRYPMNVQTKGGVVPFRSKIIVITSNQHPRFWYNYGERMQYAAIVRRINEVHLFPPHPQNI